jgi:hypothetical protein
LSKGQEGVYLCLLSLQKELENENQWISKEGVWQSYGFQRESSQTKIVPTIKNTMKSVHFAKGGNILKYKAKTNPLSKLRNSCPFITLTLQLVHMSKHKCKKEKTPPLEICDKVWKEFVVVHKKCLTKHEGQVVKQVWKPERIFEHPTLPEPIIREKSQHYGIGSHLFYLNLPHCNVS